MRIIGVDPGYHRIGFAVVDATGNKLDLVHSGLTETDSMSNFADRLHMLFDSITETIGRFGPDAMALEELFFAKNTKTAMGVAHARGVIMLAASKLGVHIYEYTPNTVKLTLTSSGNAAKSQVKFMVVRLLGINPNGKLDDEIDAMAVAVCHAFKKGGASL